MAGLVALAPAWGEERIYATWDVLEPDSCASVWLIKRHIDPGAVFRFYPRGAPITEGIAFDTPDARWRRDHNRSTFEVLLQHYRLEAPILRDLGRLIHDLEINVWERKVLPETGRVEAELRELLADGEAAALVQRCIDYFDAWGQRP